MSGAISYTRSAAVQRNQMVVICKSPDGEKCSTKGHWEGGWLIYVDENDNRERDEDERRLSVQRALPHTTLRYRAFGSRHYIAYRPDGFTQTNGTFTLCARQTPELKKALILTKSGRLRVSPYAPGGKPLKCP